MQARPITALPVRPTFELPTQGTWEKDASHFTDPMTPIGASLYFAPFDGALTEMASTYGLLIDGAETRCFGGEMYTRIIPPGGKDGPAPPWWLMGLLLRVVPPLRAKLRKARAALAEGLPRRMLARWPTEFRPELEKRIAELRAVDLTALDDAGLRAHLDRVCALTVDPSVRSRPAGGMVGRAPGRHADLAALAGRGRRREGHRGSPRSLRVPGDPVRPRPPDDGRAPGPPAGHPARSRGEGASPQGLERVLVPAAALRAATATGLLDAMASGGPRWYATADLARRCGLDPHRAGVLLAVHLFDDALGRAIVRRAAASVAPGGRLGIIESVNEDSQGERRPALLRYELSLFARTGKRPCAHSRCAAGLVRSRRPRTPAGPRP